MRLIIQKDYQTVSSWAARYVARKIRDFKPSSEKKFFVLGLPTGSTPLGFYKELITYYKAGKISFKNVVTFNMDEYIALPRDHEESYYTFMWKNFFSFIDIPREHVHILDGNAPSLEAECQAYEDRIRSFGGIDVFVGGIGVDGHIAFNEPGSSLSSRTRVKTLTEDTRLVNARFFGGDMHVVPQKALTVGVGTIMDAREVLIIISGHAKAHALREGVEGAVSHMNTFSALQWHQHALVVCDEASTIELKSGTVSYFRQIEAAQADPEI